MIFGRNGEITKNERIYLMEQYISSRDFVSIPELVEHFHVSVNTVRRDLNLLQEAGKIDKVYGGAKRAENSDSFSELLRAYSERNVTNTAEKYRIAGRAAQYICEGDVIFIDTGTSTVPLLQHIGDLHHLTIITNSVYVLYSAIELSSFTVIGLPGILKHKTASLVGEQCLEMIDTYNIDKAFMACSALSLQSGVSNSSMEEYSIKKRVLERSLTHYLLADSSKFDKSSLLTFAELTDFDYIITDKEPSSEYADYFSGNRIQLISTDVPADDRPADEISAECPKIKDK